MCCCQSTILCFLKRVLYWEWTFILFLVPDYIHSISHIPKTCKKNNHIKQMKLKILPQHVNVTQNFRTIIFSSEWYGVI